MTILWCGGEDVDFNAASSYVAYHDSNFARTNLIRSSDALNYTNTPFDVVTNVWLHCRFICWTGWVNTPFVGIAYKVSPTDIRGLFFGEGTSGTGYPALFKKDESSFVMLQDSSAGAWGSGYMKTLDMYVEGYGASSSVSVYIDRELSFTFEGDTSIDGVSGFNTVSFLGNTSAGVSEIIVADEDTRLMRLKTLAPSAAGDTSINWTGAYTDIGEVTLSDADKIYSSTADADFQANLTGMPTGTFSIKAVKVAARCVDGSGSKGIALGVKSGGTVNVGDTETCAGYWQTKERLMQVNPVTGVSFTPAEIEALQINLRAKAL